MSKYGQVFERLSNQGADQEDLLLLIRLERAANQNHWAETLDKAVKFGTQLKDATKLAAEVRLVTLRMREEAERYENS